MNDASQLREELSNYNLLNHEFYQHWNNGTLTIKTLREYAKQYFWHVLSFPQALSAIHSSCPTMSDRKVILENLVEEEYNEPNHPELWLEFAKGLGLTNSEVQASIPNAHTKNLLATFRDNCRDSYEAGLGTLFAHEWQYSKIAETKEQGLQQHYNVKNETALKFFSVHKEVDVWHAEQLETLLNRLPAESYKNIKDGAIKAAKALWQFLDGMLAYHNSQQAA